MSQEQTLHEKLTGAIKSEFNPLSLPDISQIVKKNINQSIEIRPYQDEAIRRFIFFLESYKSRQKPTHLLFNMATGSGKTLIMAASMLYLYERGYRNFIFFVNSTNIIEKTRDNFLNDLSIKYLFSADKQVRIQEVTNFEVTDNDGINVVFTTIQGLHTMLNTPSENSVTYEDFIDKKIVLLADEAHHINALTKSKLDKTEAEEKTSWEGTVDKIFKMNSDNLLLEFTATIDMADKNIAAKYTDKILFKYTLKEFRKDKYSKDVDILSVDSAPIERAFNALILSQYRLKIAERNGLFIKPTILMKSKTIGESKKFEEEFHKFVKKLSANDFQKAKMLTKTVPVLKRAFDFFEDNNIDFDNLAEEFKIAFGVEQTISVNSKDDSEEKQITINTLEDRNNHIRVVFAVDKLNEGWDVLNLFDIVRLYETRDGKNNKPGKTTMAEAQLIGRGARYFPFSLNGEDKYKRKFDEDLTNDMRILEELYYHSQQDSRYISELKIALVEVGLQDDDTVIRVLKIKDSFKQTNLWKYGLIFLNKRRENCRDDIFGLDEKSINSKTFFHSLRTGAASSMSIFDDEVKEIASIETVDKSFMISSFGSHIIRRAMQCSNFYLFSNLQRMFPSLQSINEFINNENYLGQIEIKITGPIDRLNSLTADEKLTICIEVLNAIEKEILTNSSEYQGTKEFYPHSISSVFKDTEFQTTSKDEKSKGMRDHSTHPLDLRDKDWYAHEENYGTIQEKSLVRFINSSMDDIKRKYETAYLLRNERHFKIYTFNEGLAFEPDFVLFLSRKEADTLYAYQVFIEPKGEHLIGNNDSNMKSKFLAEIEKEHTIPIKYENQEFRLIGMPFYNDAVNSDTFNERFTVLTMN